MIRHTAVFRLKHAVGSAAERAFFKKQIQAAYRTAIKLNMALRGYEYQYVFILSHMRSGSTLVAHLLASHPKFAGAGEMHLAYRTPADFENLVVETCRWLHKLQIRVPYIVDQINHDRFLVDEVLSSPRIFRCVILIRQPEATLRSLIKLFGWQQKVALDYYVSRLKALAEYGRNLSKRAIFMEYDDLIGHTDDTLAALTNFFGVTPPFKPHYATRRTTGVSGDPSANIRTGQIVRMPSDGIQIDREILSQASIAFENCRQQLLLGGVQPVGIEKSTSPS